MDQTPSPTSPPAEEPATPPTTRTKTKRHEPHVELARDADGWHWCLWSGNGVMMARSPEPYKTKKHCVQAIRSLPAMFAKVEKIVAVDEPDEVK